MEADQADRLRDLGTQIRRRRQHQGLTQRQAAEKASMALATWNDAELGKKQPQGGTLTRMEQLLGFREGSFSRFLAEGTPLELTAAAIAGLANPARPATTKVDASDPDSPGEDSSEQIFAIVANEGIPLTPEERADIARIARAVWHRNNPGGLD